MCFCLLPSFGISFDNTDTEVKFIFTDAYNINHYSYFPKLKPLRPRI